MLHGCTFHGASLPRPARTRHSPGMRTGADYRASLNDGRRIFVLGYGWVEDVATHPATCAMTEEYVTWYDRHFDPAWQDLVLTRPDSVGKRIPIGYLVPRVAQD